MKRQQRKLNFLITQTELYAHFMSRKMTGATDAAKDAILNHLDESKSSKELQLGGKVVTDVAGDNYGESFTIQKKNKGLLVWSSWLGHVGQTQLIRFFSDLSRTHLKGREG